MRRVGGAVLALFLAASTSRADEPIDACLAAHRRGQELERADMLVEARQVFDGCLRAECPDVVRDQCTLLSLDVERATPSVVIVVRDAAGRDRLDVPVTLDGRDLGSAQRGTAVALNPGRHVARAAPRTGLPAEEVFVAHESEKARLVSIVLPEPQRSRSVAKPAPADDGITSGSAIGITLLTTGALAVAAAVALWSVAYVRYRELDEQCTLSCADDAAAARRLAIAGDVLAPLGAIALGVGAYLVATAPNRDASGFGLVLSGRF